MKTISLTDKLIGGFFALIQLFLYLLEHILKKKPKNPINPIRPC
jgi:hypothetical protein